MLESTPVFATVPGHPWIYTLVSLEPYCSLLPVLRAPLLAGEARSELCMFGRLFLPFGSRSAEFVMPLSLSLAKITQILPLHPSHTIPRPRVTSPVYNDTVTATDYCLVFVLGAASGVGGLLAWRRWGMRLLTAKWVTPNELTMGARCSHDSPGENHRCHDVTIHPSSMPAPP
jgi:hypothetical protein